MIWYHGNYGGFELTRPRRLQAMKRWLTAVFWSPFLIAPCAVPAWAIDGGTLRMNPRNGWRAFEVISVGDNPAGGVNYAMPGTFDGIGAWLPDAATLRLEINHENTDANVSEVNLNLAYFQTAIRNMISGGTTGGVSFVTSAQQAYTRWSANAGSSWTNTSDVSTTSFYRFCSSQLHKADTFGTGRGFVDNIYITGEEGSTNRLFALDVANRDLYQLSGVVGSASGGIGGMPYDPWENAALLDTGETNHVALLLSPDGGTQVMQLYIGDKGKDAGGLASNSFLARNGLAYGRYYYLNDALPTSGTSTDGIFATSSAGAPTTSKLEDVDTNPNDPTQAVVGNQNYGVFMFDFNFDFSGGNFSTTGSSFSITKLQNPATGVIGSLGDADNVDWTAATTLNGVSYPNGLIFVNEDSSSANGETWMVTPTAGSTPTLIADDTGIAGTTESSGILDISALVGFKPGSILLTDVQGSNSSLTVLINPNAALAGDFNGDGKVDAADYVVWRKGLGTTYMQSDYDTWRAQVGQTPGTAGGPAPDLSVAAVVPEPPAIDLLLFVATAALPGLRSRPGLHRCRS